MIKKATSTITEGAKKALQPESLGVVAGFAGSRVVERLAYGMFLPVFGVNDGVNTLTTSQRTARIVLKAGAAVLVAGTLFGAKQPVVRGAAVGLVGGWTWHLLNDFGVNV